MPTNLNKLKEQVTALRNYFKGLPAPANATSVCYLLKAEEIQRLLNQKAGGIPLDGLRIYLGAEFTDGKMVPTVSIVACEKVNADTYHDYNIPETEALHALAATANPAQPMGELYPCPTHCSNSNILNP